MLLNPNPVIIYHVAEYDIYSCWQLYIMGLNYVSLSVYLDTFPRGFMFYAGKQRFLGYHIHQSGFVQLFL